MLLLISATEQYACMLRVCEGDFLPLMSGSFTLLETTRVPTIDDARTIRKISAQAGSLLRTQRQCSLHIQGNQVVEVGGPAGATPLRTKLWSLVTAHTPHQVAI